MVRIRYSIARLLGVVALTAIVFESFRSVDSASFEVWLKILYTTTVCVLTMAAILAKFYGAFWYGFMVTEWAYFIVGVGINPGGIESHAGLIFLPDYLLKLVACGIAFGNWSVPFQNAQLFAPSSNCECIWIRSPLDYSLGSLSWWDYRSNVRGTT